MAMNTAKTTVYRGQTMIEYLLLFATVILAALVFILRGDFGNRVAAVYNTAGDAMSAAVGMENSGQPVSVEVIKAEPGS